MAQPNTYLHYLRYWDGFDWYYYHLDSLGDVFENLTKTAINRAPDGWLDYEIEWERGFTYFGMFTNISPPARFCKDGAKILRHIFANEGIEGKCQLLIEQLNRTTYAYETAFMADLDFSTYQDEFDHVSIGIVEYGFPALLKAREDTVYEIELQANADVRWLFHDGILLDWKMLWVGSPNEDFNTIPTLSWVDTEGTNLYYAPYNQALGTTYIDLIENRGATPTDVVFNIDYRFYLEQTSGVAGELHVQIALYSMSDHLVTSTITYIDPFVHSSGINHLYEHIITETVTIPNGYGAHIRVRLWSPSASAYIDPTLYIVTSVDRFDVTVSGQNRHTVTYAPTLKASDLFNQLIGKMTEGTNYSINTVSTLMTTTYLDQICITSGDGLMNLKNSKIKTSLKDFYNFMRSKFGVCMYFNETNDTLYIEDISTVFEGSVNSSYTNIGEVKSCRVSPFTQEQFVQLKIGSKTYNYDQKGSSNYEVTNGKDEFNQELQWESPITRVKKTIDYVSPYRDDMYGIEFQRINMDGKTISEGDSDSMVFAIHTTLNSVGTAIDKHTGNIVNVWAVYRKAINLTAGASFWNIININNPETAYNILFSPARCLLRNGAWFRSLLLPYDSLTLRYTTSGKTNQTVRMETQEGAVPTLITEDADFFIQNLCSNNDLLVAPVVFDIEIKDVINLYQLIKADRYAFLQFTYLGNTYTGYIISAKTKPSFRATTKLRLLATPDTDLEDLIR